MTEQQIENNRYENYLAEFSIGGTMVPANQLLMRAATAWPQQIFVICDDHQITYKTLAQHTSKWAERYKELGVKPRDRVIIWMPNSIEFYIAYFAAWHCGAVVAPLNVFLNPHEVKLIVEDAEPALLILNAQLKAKLDKSWLSQQTAIIDDIDAKEETEHPITQPKPMDPASTAAILYTSGTTGFAKGVMLSSINIITNALQGISRFQARRDDRVYCALPLFHSLPQNIAIWITVINGSTAIILNKITRNNLLAGLKHRPTVIVAVPALYGLFLKIGRAPFPAVRYFLCGGDALPDKIKKYFELLYRRKICNGYGLTEASPFISVDIDDYRQQVNTVGRPFVSIDVQIRNETGKPLAKSQIGTLWIRGKNVMQGYWKAPDLTKEAIKDGWLNTGDLAFLDDDGKIVIAGRQKDLIIHKGINIYPQEIENILLQEEGITQAGIVGLIEDDTEIPIAFVATTEPDHEKMKRRLHRRCRQYLAGYKIPREFIVRKQLAMTATGKVDKKVLRKLVENMVKDAKDQ